MNDRERLVRLMRLPREKFEEILAFVLGGQLAFVHAPEAPRAVRAMEAIRLSQQDGAQLGRLDTSLGGEDPIADWIAKELAEHDRVPLLGFRGRVTLPLDEVFVQLQVFAGRLDDQRDDLRTLGPTGRETPQSSGHLSPTACLRFAFDRSQRGVVFLGLPGAGKTTLLKHVFTRIAQGDAAAMGLDLRERCGGNGPGPCARCETSSSRTVPASRSVSRSPRFFGARGRVKPASSCSRGCRSRRDNSTTSAPEPRSITIAACCGWARPSQARCT
jgi:hypothetical protein